MRRLLALTLAIGVSSPWIIAGPALILITQDIAGGADYGEAHFNLTVAYVALKDTKRALDEYNALKKVDPKMADVFYQGFLKKK